jgi:hypothetical protein
MYEGTGCVCKVAARVGGLKVDCLGDAACTASDGEGAVTRLGWTPTHLDAQDNKLILLVYFC